MPLSNHHVLTRWLRTALGLLALALGLGCGPPGPELKVVIDTDWNHTVITSSPAGISCDSAGTACTAAFPTGTAVTLSAGGMPAPQAVWNSDVDSGCTGNAATCNVPMNAQHEIHVNLYGLHPAEQWTWLNPAPQGNSLHAIHRVNSTTVVAVGDFGSAVRCKGGVCSALKTGTDESLQAVWSRDDSTFYMVGRAGTVLRCVTASDTCTMIFYVPGFDDGDDLSITGDTAGNVFVDIGAWETGTNAIGMPPQRYFVHKRTLWCAPGTTACTVLKYNADLIDPPLPSGPDDLYLGALGGSTSVYCSLKTATCGPVKTHLMADQETTSWRSNAGSYYFVGPQGFVARCAAGLTGCKALSSGTTADLSGIWGIDDDNVYITGGGPLLRCAAGSDTCTVMTTGTAESIGSVWAKDSANVYGISSAGTIIRCAAASSTCTPLAVPDKVPLVAVAGTDKDVYALGPDGTIVYCAGGAGSCTTTRPGGPRLALAAVWGSEVTGEVYAVGSAGAVVVCDAGSGTCTQKSAGTTRDLTVVWGDASNFYAAGYGGTVIRCPHGLGSCEPLSTGTTTNFNLLWGSDASNVYVGGPVGPLFRCAAGSTTCTAVNTAATQNFVALWGGDAKNVYAASADGPLVRCAAGPGPCTALTIDPYLRIKSIWGENVHSVYAVGADDYQTGVVLKCTDTATTCTEYYKEKAKSFTKVKGFDDDNVYVFGDNFLLQCSAGACSYLNSNQATYQHDLWATDAEHVYVPALGGTILSCSDKSTGCNPMPLSTSNQLHSLWGSATKTVYAVGNMGTILRLTP